MKKIIFIMATSLLFYGCQTFNAYEDLSKGEPLHPDAAWFTGIIPGLTQYINGEILEGTVYLVGATSFSLASQYYMNIDTPGELSGNETFGYLGLNLIGSVLYVVSYIDGINDTKTIYNQYRELLINSYNLTFREKEAIKNKKIFLEMSEEALVLSWGKPRDINTSIGKWGTHKQYCYGTDTYVYIENGTVTAIQN